MNECVHVYTYTNLCVEAEHTNLFRFDDLYHRVGAGTIQVLLKVARFNQLP